MELLERGPALATMEEALSAARTGSGRVVAISGEPGIGKSSLVRAFLAHHEHDIRVLRGACDDLATARPHGPFFDLALDGADHLAAALEGDPDPSALLRALLADVAASGTVTVIVLEDIHWIDEASLDVLTAMMRRIEGTGALLVVTHRFVEYDTALFRALGELDPRTTRSIGLEPLSARAVAELAGADAPSDLHHQTGGNPFFVIEMLSAADDGLPTTITSALLARLHRLAPPTQQLLELMSVVPTGATYELLDACMPDHPDACAPAQQRGMLVDTGAGLAFPHALMREAVEGALPPSRRRALHRRVLDHLLEVGADDARIVHHALNAGANDVLGERGPVAARAAAAAQSHREAIAHYERVLDLESAVDDEARAALLEEVAYEYWVQSRPQEAARAVQAAVELRETIGEPVALGATLRSAANLVTWASRGDEGADLRRRAIEVLEPLGPTKALACLYADLCLDALLQLDISAANELGGRAVDTAVAVDEGDNTAALAVAKTFAGTLAHWARGDAAMLDELLSGPDHETTVEAFLAAACNRAWAAVERGEDRAPNDLDWAEAWVDRHDLTVGRAHVRMQRAHWAIDHGQWEAADTVLESVLQVVDPELMGPHLVTVYAEVVGLLALRRGEPEARTTLLGGLAAASGMSDRVAAVNLASRLLELAWLGGDSDEAAIEIAEEVLAITSDPGLPGIADLTYRMWRVGRWEGAAPEGDHPWLLAMRNDWAGAAAAWRARDRPYEAAEALAETHDEASLREAAAILDELGAPPLARRVRIALRELGVVQVPKGRQRSTRENVAGLTRRQMDVLELLAEGASNGDIAERLYLSVRTVETHVAAIFQKLEVSSRRDAAKRASELGVPGGRAEG